MNIFPDIALLLPAALVIFINLYASYLLISKKDAPNAPIVEYPRVAVLIAARNEAQALPRCLKALEKLDYPAEKLSIWIGNDDSADNTRDIAAAWSSRQSNRHLIDVQEFCGQARGKANVLAILARHAAAEAGPDFYFITDADVAVGPGWIQGLLAHFTKETGIVSGTTVVEADEGLWRWQRYDWAFALGLAKAFIYVPFVGRTLMAIGNNMAVRRDAYEAAGGYERIPFSITEDYELHRQLTKLGYHSKQLATPAAKVHTLPSRGWQALLHQRKRWMHGAMELPAAMVAILFIQALFFPAILVVLFYAPLWGLGVLLLKLLSQTLLIRHMLQRLDEPAAFPFVYYELYSLLLNMSLIVFYFMPVPVRWKGRTYKNNIPA